MSTNKLTSLVKKVHELRKAMQEQGRQAVNEAFSEFFQKHPSAKAITWVQYTPYFNDGDACTFSVGEPELKCYAKHLAEDVKALLNQYADEEDLNELEDDDSEVSYGHGDSCVGNALTRLAGDAYYAKVRDITPEERSLCDDFNALAEGIQNLEEVMQMVFEDHCQVIATKDGFQIEGYDHD